MNDQPINTSKVIHNKNKRRRVHAKAEKALRSGKKPPSAIPTKEATADAYARGYREDIMVATLIGMARNNPLARKGHKV